MKDKVDKLLEDFFKSEYIDVAGMKDMEIPDMQETLEKVKKNAYKADLNNSKSLPFHLLVPTYLPPGYTLDNAEWTQHPNNYHMVEQAYKDGGKGIITIIQHYNKPNAHTQIDIVSNNTPVKIVDINGVETCLVVKEGEISLADWYDGTSRYLVMGPVSEDELISIIEGLE